MANPTDLVRIAWALMDGVRGVSPPSRYESDVGGVPVSQLVFESSGATRMSAWWSKHRVRLLGQAMDGAQEEEEDDIQRHKRWEGGPQAAGGGCGGHVQPRQGSQVHEQAVRAHRLVAAGQPLEVPGGRDASQAGAEPRPDLPQLRLRQGDAVGGVAPGVV